MATFSPATRLLRLGMDLPCSTRTSKAHFGSSSPSTQTLRRASELKSEQRSHLLLGRPAGGSARITVLRVGPALRDLQVCWTSWSDHSERRGSQVTLSGPR